MKSLILYFLVIQSLVIVGCTPANVQVSLSSRSNLTEITTNEKINSENQSAFALEGTCKDKSTTLEVTISDSAGVVSTQSVECLSEQFKLQTDLSVMTDGDIRVEIKGQSGIKVSKKLKKNSVVPEVTVQAPSASFIHKNSELLYRINVSKSEFEFDSQKLKLQGQTEGCELTVGRPLFSTGIIEVVIRNCRSEGQVALMLEPGFIKDNFGNKNSIKSNQHPVQIRNNTVRLIWGLPTKKVINSSLVSQIPFKVEGYELASNGVTSFPDISMRLEAQNGLAGCSITQSGTFPDFYLTLANCDTGSQTNVKFRLPANEFTNAAGLKNELGAWSSEVIVDNVKPTLVITPPTTLVGSAGTLFSFKIDYPSSDLFQLDTNNVLITGDNDNCAKTITESAGKKYLNIFGCSVNSGTVGVKILSGAIKDEAGNISDEWIFSNNLVINNTGPIVSIGSPNFYAVNASRTVEVPVTFTNATTIQLTSSKVEITMSGSVSGCTVSIASDSNPNVKRIRLTNCSGDGSLNFKVLAGAAVASAGVQSSEVASPTSIKVDNTPPVVLGYSDDGVALKSTSFRGEIEFSEKIQNISTNSITTSSGFLTDYLGNDKVVSFNINPTFLVTNLTLSIPANAYHDEAGNQLASYSKVIACNTKPSILLTSLAPSPHVRSRFQVLLTADQPIFSPIPSNFSIVGGSISSVIGVLGSYVLYVEPLAGSSNIELKVQSEQLKSSASNLGSQISNTLSWIYEEPLVIGFEKNNIEILEGNAVGESRFLKIKLDRVRSQATSINLKVLRETSTATMSMVTLDDQVVTIPANVSEHLISFTVNGDTSNNSENKHLDVVLSSSDPAVVFKIAGTRLKILDDEKNYKFSQVSVGVNHTCAITDGLKIKCWGQNDFGKLGIGTAGSVYNSPKEVDSANSYTKVSAGGSHTCALTTTGAVKCWGSNSRGQLGISTTTTNSLHPSLVSSANSYTDIGVGVSHTCALRTDRLVDCWGDNSAGQLGDSTTISRSNPISIYGAMQFSKISVGASHSCALGLDSKIYCWGANGSKQISANTGSYYIPTLIDSDNLYFDVATSVTSTCGLNSSKEAICFGAIIGASNGTNNESKNFGGAFDKILVGGNHLCGIQADKTVKCLGSNSSGQLGTGLFSTQISFSAIPGVKFDYLSLGYEGSCGINESSDLLCWGLNTLGQLGLGFLSFKSNPTTLTAAIQFHTVSSGLLNQSQCAIDSNMKLRCWGYNYFDQLGVSRAAIEQNLRVVANEKNFIKVSSGEMHTCAITDAHKLYCWGNGSNGRLGDGTDFSSSQPSLVDGNTDFSDVEVGRDHSCAITTGKELKCWGLNDKLQLGLSINVSLSNVPKVVDAGNQYLQVSLGFRHTCALGVDLKVKCWGWNDFGQLGNGQAGTDKVSGPVVIQSGLLFNKVRAGFRHTCAISDSNKMYCWGINTFGQLGNATTSNASVPMAIDASESYVDLALNSNHSCGITTSGSMKCWGLNNWGQLGDGTQVNSTVPVIVSDSEIYSKVSLGSSHTCATTNGTNRLRCWGRNDANQLGLLFPTTLVPQFVR